ncbi:ABC transporter family protein [Histomonas meleagridis]|uniref:ABC transporter family protein n=1 Tax=Histomonas meleagridis TaxID=135588 RepID=UPI00355A327B|nr:ABC transporter family protein [Histomonas meleagridis]KAH0799498.1 ABC transporter family protein [Histomonas meleagridis]
MSIYGTNIARGYSSEYTSIDTTIVYNKPSGDLDPKKEMKARFRLYGMLLKHPKAAIGIIPSFIFGAAPIITFTFLGRIINCLAEYSISNGTADILPEVRIYAYSMVGVAFALGICKFFDSFLWIRVGSEFTTDLKAKLFDKLMRSEVTYFDVTSIGTILTLLGEETQAVQDSFGITKANEFQYIGQMLSGFILTYVFAWKLGLVITCIIPWAVILIFIFSKFVDRHVNLRFIHVSDSMTIAEETLSTIRTVRGFNREDSEVKRFSEKTDLSTREYRKFGFFLDCMFSLVMLGLWCILLGNLYFGATLVDKGELDSGNLMSVFGYMTFGSFSIINLQTSLQGEQKAIHAGSRILEMIEHESSIPFDGGEIIEDFKGHIEFQNVSFKYPTRDAYVLKNVSFEIKPGQMGALVGHSGSGKSTCVQLLERYYDVIEGAILLDGHDIRTLDPHWLHQKMGLVSQEPTLFQLSVEDNIKYGARDATDEMVRYAAEQANALKFIEKLEGKFKYFVGEKGDTVSGGQRQRIAIARALIKDPVILITDEATSALDAASEKKVQAALDKVMVNRTSVVVAHRLSTIRNANVIYVFDAGEIVEIGNHESLLKKKGHYYELVKRQLDDDKKQQNNTKEKVIEKIPEKQQQKVQPKQQQKNQKKIEKEESSIESYVSELSTSSSSESTETETTSSEESSY